MRSLFNVVFILFILALVMLAFIPDVDADGPVYQEGTDTHMSTSCTPPTTRTDGTPIDPSEMNMTELVLSQDPTMAAKAHTVLISNIFCTANFDLSLLNSEGQWYKTARIRDTEGRWSEYRFPAKGFVWNLAAVEPPIELAPDIPADNWSVVYVDSEELVNWRMEARYAFNRGNPDEHELWHTQYQGAEPPHPHEIRVDMGRTYSVSGFQQQPRAGGGNGTIKDYEFHLSTNTLDWTMVASGTFPPGDALITVTFDPVEARYFKLVALSEQDGGPHTSVDEIYERR